MSHFEQVWTAATIVLAVVVIFGLGHKLGAWLTEHGHGAAGARVEAAAKAGDVAWQVLVEVHGAPKAQAAIDEAKKRYPELAAELQDHHDANAA